MTIPFPWGGGRGAEGQDDCVSLEENCQGLCPACLSLAFRLQGQRGPAHNQTSLPEQEPHGGSFARCQREVMTQRFGKQATPSVPISAQPAPYGSQSISRNVNLISSSQKCECEEYWEIITSYLISEKNKTQRESTWLCQDED